MKSQTPRTKSQTISKFQIINAQILILTFLILSGCMKFQKQKTVIEPISIVIVDESRIDNLKIRHIFAEFLLKEIINNSRGWLNVFDADTFSNQYVDYLISFDIMDYGSADIEKGTEKLLVSTKIIKVANRNIINSYVESAVAKNIEQTCQRVAENLSRALVNKLFALHRYKVPKTATTPEDSL